MRDRGLFMETTKVETAKTVGEIQRILSLYGATSIRTDFDHGEVIGLSFLIVLPGNEVGFRLPARWKPVFDHLQRKRKWNRKVKEPEDMAQAKRVAWRQILRWVEAQLALVDTGMVKVQEVFLPYMAAKGGGTLYDYIEESGFKMIEYKE